MDYEIQPYPFPLPDPLPYPIPDGSPDILDPNGSDCTPFYD